MKVLNQFAAEEAGAIIANAPGVVKDALRVLQGVTTQEEMPQMLGAAVAMASAFQAAELMKQQPGKDPAALAEVAHAGQWVMGALNATAQGVSLWASGLLEEAGRLGDLFQQHLDEAEEEGLAALPDLLERRAEMTIAVRPGSARREGEDWILPMEAQLYWRNEGRQTMLLALCRQLLFRALKDVDNRDFDEKAVQLYEERARLLFRSLQLPLTGERAAQRLEVRIGGPRAADATAVNGGWRPLPLTDSQGVVEASIRFSESELTFTDRLRGRVPVEVRFAQEQEASVAAPAKAVAHLVEREGLSVISDIDDTVKVTEVFQGPKAVLRNTLLKLFRPVPGMPELFKRWAGEHGASFHFVSKSPPELHKPLAQFLHNEGFPVNSLHLCPLLGFDRANFKMREVEALLAQFPNRRFVLVGDAGEHDAEVYAGVLRRHPNQIVKALIREVPGRRELAQEAFKGLDTDKWQVFADPNEVTLPEQPGWPLQWRFPSTTGVTFPRLPELPSWGMPVTAAGVMVD